VILSEIAVNFIATDCTLRRRLYTLRRVPIAGKPRLMKKFCISLKKIGNVVHTHTHMGNDIVQGVWFMDHRENPCSLFTFLSSCMLCYLQSGLWITMKWNSNQVSNRPVWSNEPRQVAPWVVSLPGRPDRLSRHVIPLQTSPFLASNTCTAMQLLWPAVRSQLCCVARELCTNCVLQQTTNLLISDSKSEVHSVLS
jgi:hypothetical protein